MNEIARRIIFDRYRRNYCINNYTPPRWFECDVFELTASGFFREYEIKTSRSDFKADGRKLKSNGEWTDGHGWRRLPDRVKHEELAGGSLLGPSRFYFVTPVGLIERSDLPKWAGLIEWMDNDGYSFPWNISLNTVVEAPSLHRCKFSEDRRRKLLETCYWRYHGISLHRTVDESQPVCV